MNDEHNLIQSKTKISTSPDLTLKQKESSYWSKDLYNVQYVVFERDVLKITIDHFNNVKEEILLPVHKHVPNSSRLCHVLIIAEDWKQLVLDERSRNEIQGNSKHVGFSS